MKEVWIWDNSKRRYERWGVMTPTEAIAFRLRQGWRNVTIYDYDGNYHLERECLRPT